MVKVTGVYKFYLTFTKLAYESISFDFDDAKL